MPCSLLCRPPIDLCTVNVELVNHLLTIDQHDYRITSGFAIQMKDERITHHKRMENHLRNKSGSWCVDMW